MTVERSPHPPFGHPLPEGEGPHIESSVGKCAFARTGKLNPKTSTGLYLHGAGLDLDERLSEFFDLTGNARSHLRSIS